MEWSNRLPELGSLLKDKLRVFDRPLALWQQLQTMLGDPTALVASDAEIRLGPAAIEFLSPTFSEFLLFFAILVLFHCELERSAPGADPDFCRSFHPAAHLADSKRNRGASRRLSDHRDHDQSRGGCCDRHHLRGHRHAEPGRAWRAAATLNYFPIIRPGGHVSRS